MSPIRKLFSFTGLLALGISTVNAQGVPQSIADCASQKRDATRLACFDREVAKLTQPEKSVVPTPVDPTSPGPFAPIVATEQHKNLSPKDDEFGVSGDLARKRAQATKSVNAPLQELHASITGIKSKPYGELVLELDNGQVWEQAEQRSDVLIQPNDPVTIKPGLLGAFYLTDVAHQTIRFRRVR